MPLNHFLLIMMQTSATMIHEYKCTIPPTRNTFQLNLPRVLSLAYMPAAAVWAELMQGWIRYDVSDAL
jgi:hypothetical protein